MSAPTASGRIAHMPDDHLRAQRDLSREEADRAHAAGDLEFASGARTMADACEQALARRARGAEARAQRAGATPVAA
jgi:hypothetical protein